MISVAVIDAMVAAGCSAEQIVAVMRADAVATEAQAELDREQECQRGIMTGAERQAAYRARVKAREEAARLNAMKNSDETVTEVTDSDVTSRNVTPPVTDNGSSLSPFPPSFPPHPPNNPLTPKPISKNQNSRAHRLPETAQIAGPDLAYGLSRGLTQRETCELWQRMASWAWSASGKNASKVNWHQAFQGWVQRDAQEIIRKRTPGKPLTEHQRKQHETKDILDELSNFATGGGRGDEENFGLLRYDHGERSPAVHGSLGGHTLDLSPSGRDEGG